jgi:hypothetical protein
MKVTKLKTCLFITSIALGLGDLWAQNQYIPREKDWFSYDITTLFLLDAPAAYEEEGWSNGHTISFMKDFLLGRSNFSIALGLAYTSNNFKSNVRLRVNEATGEATFSVIPDTVRYNRNKVNAKYVEIPVELRFRSRPDKNGRFLRLTAGFRGGIRFSSYSRFANDEAEIRYYHPQELNRWSAGTYLRLGYGTVSLYGYYSLLPLFDYVAAPNLPATQVNTNNMLPLALGLSLSL